MSKNPLWLNDEIQFARLLSEIRANGQMDVDQVLNADLCHSMDLTPDEVESLFDRAQVAWEKVKAGAVTVPDPPPKDGGYYRTVIEIWSDYDGDSVELEDLARAATSGDAICTKQVSVAMEICECPQMEFFGFADGLECPSCGCGTLEEVGDELRCMGECGNTTSLSKS